MKLRCLVGLHVWTQSRAITPADYFPFSSVRYRPPTRQCSACGKRQKWLPGYGGSELGSWMTEQSDVDV